jgi:hypothetical protein
MTSLWSAVLECLEMHRDAAKDDGRRPLVLASTVEAIVALGTIKTTCERLAKVMDDGANRGGIYRDDPAWWERLSEALSAWEEIT